MSQLQDQREALLEFLARNVPSPSVVSAMASVPRERFVPLELRSSAYDNEPLPIGNDQTISQPLIVAMMTAVLELTGRERVLEIGTGSGYQAAVLSLLAEEVITVERIPALADQARERLRALGYRNVRVEPTTGVIGWPAEAPYDAILVAAGAPSVPPSLLDQMAEGGRMVIPVGDMGRQRLLRIRRTGAGFSQDDLGSCAFVPLIGEQGWREASG